MIENKMKLIMKSIELTQRYHDVTLIDDKTITWCYYELEFKNGNKMGDPRYIKFLVFFTTPSSDNNIKIISDILIIF